MASEMKTGGPAFPAPAQPRTDMTLEDVTSGMTLRDWFAGQALTGLCAHYGNVIVEEKAVAAYKLADALLKARGEAQ